MFGLSVAVPPYGCVILSRMFRSGGGRRCVSMVTKLPFKERANEQRCFGARRCKKRPFPVSQAAHGVSRGLSRRPVPPPPPSREESELFPGFKQAQIVANLCVLGAPSAREEE